MSRIIFLFIIIISVSGCKKKESTPQPEPVEPVETVGTISLIAPAQNSICITGTVISANQSSVELKWDKVPNATSYTVSIKDLSTDVTSTFTTDQILYSATLNRNTPYSWSVKAQANVPPKTAKSDTWKFYNAGSGTVSYAPFPADNLSPGKDESVSAVAGKITLTWKGSDVDNDILNYDVYLGTVKAPPLLKKEITEEKLENVDVTTKTTYYWKVITRDKKGNTSESAVNSFSIK